MEDFIPIRRIVLEVNFFNLILALQSLMLPIINCATRTVGTEIVYIEIF